MEAVIEQHAAFFDGLINLVPARYYYEQQDASDTKYLKKNARAEQKKVFKEQYKINKRAKLDPDLALTTLKAQQLEAEQNANGLAGDTVNGNSAQHSLNSKLSLGGKPATRDELRDKLQQRLSKHRDQRKADTAKVAKEWLNSKRQEAKQKLKSNLQNKRKPEQSTADADTPPTKKPKPSVAAAQQPVKQQQSDIPVNLAFGRIDVGDSNDRKKREKKKTKAQLLQEAEAKREKLKELESNREGKEVVQQEAWRSALMRAKGEKVLDDPKLLRKSLKKEHRQKAKNSKAWQERVHHQEERKAAKQKRRTENITGRQQTKLAKKKEKREKKLLRAGFEGRKSTVIGAKA